MRTSAAILLSGVVGGICGWAAAVATRSPSLPYTPRSASADIGLRQGGTNLEDDSLREVVAELRALVAVMKNGDRETADTAPKPQAIDDGVEAVRRVLEPGPIPAARWDLLEEMTRKSQETGSFRRWLLLSEAGVLEVFGVPDRIHRTENGENWEYLAPATGGTQARIVLHMSRGRLIGWN